ncbi:outer membrane beta-barrel protein [Kiritimatiellota bacterium B12222]|nr:outer membrane beta-barrel protein [Kiritimatiellota bacterium B12222]
MNKKLLITLGAVMAMLSFSALQAETLLGSTYFGLSAGATFFGDQGLKDNFGESYEIGFLASFNVAPNLDIAVNGIYGWSDGEVDAISEDFEIGVLDADFIYSFSPGQAVNPYLNATIGVTTLQYNINDIIELSAEETEISIGMGGGVEFETSESTLMRLGLEYITIDIQDIVDLYGSFGFWLNENSMLALQLDYDFESENFSSGLAYIYKP